MLSIKNLAVSFQTRRGPVQAVRDVNLHVDKGEMLGIVGESGSGKSVTSFAVMQILDRGGSVTAGEITYSNIDLKNASQRMMGDIRGREISMIFQNPRAALNPIRKIGHQLEDVLRRHARATAYDAKQKAISALETVKIKDAEARYHAYPFELSGGMCQRVVIAIALACDPKLLIADEPTTGLDITTQKAVMDLVKQLSHERNMSAILITHDLGLAAQYCDRIVVMKDGMLVEQGAPQKLFKDAEHAYTKKLVAATPRHDVSIRELLPQEQRQPEPERAAIGAPLLTIKDLVKTYQGKSGPVHAVKGISFNIRRGASVALVGESGCGKSTTSSMIARLLDPTSGQIIFDGADLADLPSTSFAQHHLRKDIQMVFQDATDSLNPRFSAEDAICEPLIHLQQMRKDERSARVRELADLVGLPQTLLSRFPHQLSGGQKARVGIARAISVNPKLLILDEPTAALDVSIQAIILNLLTDLRAKLGMTYLFVSHDLHVVRLLCDEIIVMKDGQVVEQGVTKTIMENPTSNYTQSLLDAAPSIEKNLNP